ncbi:Spy/CpxP family protein refolding chaperone [Phenylobacterium sp.]|uniref:Spy/CpxP family protein refolding chaperone n=1 Tax=Phenylobacterium sp. TaxID=1871053 RepID=UPI002CF7C183|nr:Spy/CpxP family protein refolding chaperone [Phenylobacterium sp.]HLZ74331.1 Spy/CpxP family protein refolding chaperone [Phenylobacterium sp.]
MSRPVLGYLAGAAFALAATTAFAQAAAPAAPATPAASDHEHGQRIERRVIMRDGGEGHHMDQAEHLRTMLQLKPSQEAALTAYLAAVKPDHRHETIVEMSNHGDGAHGDAPKTTPQRLADMETRLAEQTAQGKARIEATRKFYDQLEPSQKKVFDELPMLMIGPMGPMMNMGNMRVMVNMEGVPPLPPLPPMPPRPAAPPHL